MLDWCFWGGSLSLDEIVVLALVQGFSAVLPISAWAHVLVIKDVLGWFVPTPQIMFAAHTGTLLATLLYLWREIWQIARGLVLWRKRQRDRGRHLAVNLAVASMPILGGGFFSSWLLGTFALDVVAVAWLSIGFGVLFFAIDRLGMTIRRIEHMTAPGALALGIAGAVALIPGASRVGMVVLAARLLGYERMDAARVGFMLSVPIMFASSPLGLSAIGSDVSFLDPYILAAAGIAGLTSYVGIASMMRWISRERFTAFAAYSIGFGALLLYWLYG
jgi:undecaprenyl-diphosphatase